MPLPLILEPADFWQQRSQLTDDLLIIDVGSEQRYAEGHIPGAVNVPSSQLILGDKPAPGLLPPLYRLEELFGQLGLTPQTQVVVYDDEGGAWAGRMIWTLDVIGHAHTSYLNGGLIAWKAEGLPLETTPNQREPIECKLSLHTSPMADLDDIVSLIGKPDFVVWDARSPEEYRGEKVLAQRGGHIPGAINCEFTNLMDKDRGCRIRTDAAEYLAGYGLTPQQHIVTHCQTHRRSGLTYLVGKSLGFNIRAYPGSWSEWGNNPDTPVES